MSIINTITYDIIVVTIENKISNEYYNILVAIVAIFAFVTIENNISSLLVNQCSYLHIHISLYPHPHPHPHPHLYFPII